jgi:hypothetical protein
MTFSRIYAVYKSLLETIKLICLYESLLVGGSQQCFRAHVDAAWRPISQLTRSTSSCNYPTDFHWLSYVKQRCQHFHLVSCVYVAIILVYWTRTQQRTVSADSIISASRHYVTILIKIWFTIDYWGVILVGGGVWTSVSTNHFNNM